MMQRMLRIRPNQLPQTPRTAWKGRSSMLWPCAFIAARKRICAKQIEPLRSAAFWRAVPCEERRETGKRKQPVEDLHSLLGDGSNVCEETESKTEDQSDEWTTAFVDVHEDLWGLSLFCEGLESTSCAVG